jgi:metallo-beta-lactamase class B
MRYSSEVRAARAAAAVVSAAALAALLMRAPTVAAQEAPPSQAGIDAHVAAATRAAGDDLKPLLSLCEPPDGRGRPSPEETAAELGKAIAQPAPPPGRAFDNLYFVGAAWVSAWVLKTSDGLILIDALNNEAEAAALIDGGLRRLGLDPAQIRLILVTHGHGDHYGGAPSLAAKTKARVVMSEADWAMTEGTLEFDAPVWGRPPRRDIAVQDGDTVALGDTTLTVYATPGHTMGTLSPVFEVRAGERTHRVLEWGGTSFNFGPDLARLDAYIESTQRMSEVVRERRIDVLISNHARFDGAIAKLDALRRDPAAPNPFVIGTGNVLRALEVMGECARATRERYRLAKR